MTVTQINLSERILHIQPKPKSFLPKLGFWQNSGVNIIHFIKYKAYYKITHYCCCNVFFICFETCLLAPQVLKLGGMKGFSGGCEQLGTS